jgi:hypothetical protein
MESFAFERIIDYDEEFETTNMYIGYPRKYTQACVFITVDSNNTAVLQHASYRPTCAKDGSLKSGSGSISMLQCALKYTFAMSPKVKRILINDKTMVPTGAIHVTAKRLLQGRQGWYQEALGAVPDRSHQPTTDLMKELGLPKTKQLIEDNKHITAKKDWGTHTDIEQLAAILLPRQKKNIVGTMWVVDRATVSKYKCNHTIVQAQQKGGTQRRRRIDKKVTDNVRKNVESYLRMLK